MLTKTIQFLLLLVLLLTVVACNNSFYDGKYNDNSNSENGIYGKSQFGTAKYQ